MLATTQVLRAEGGFLYHVEHTVTCGTFGAPTPLPPVIQSFGIQRDVLQNPEYGDVLREREQIRIKHDERVERTPDLVGLLTATGRYNLDWRSRDVVDKDEPDDLSVDEQEDRNENGEDDDAEQ